MTNREKLNSKSNDELANVLGCQCCVYFNKYGWGSACGATFEVDDEPWCHKGVVKWLESEVKDDEPRKT